MKSPAPEEREARSAQLEVADALCKAAGVPFNPKLPKRFDDTPNEERPASHQRWWGRPFIVTETVDRMDDFYANRRDEYADKGREFWEETRAKWLESWTDGIRYDVRCLDGGAWDRSTWWGSFRTIDEAVQCALTGTGRGNRS